MGLSSLSHRSNRVVTFSSVYAFVHDRFKMVYRDLRYQGDDCYSGDVDFLSP